MQFTFSLINEAATQRFGEDFALALKKGDLVTLEGDLGAGKSTLARAIIRTLAEEDHLEVPSPTFTLVQTYNDQHLPVAHADLYRIAMPEEIDELGFDQALEDGVLLVEWPQKAKDMLPSVQFSVFLESEGDGRRITIETTEDAGARLQRSLDIRSFLETNDRKDAKRYYFVGDASPRSYEIIISNGKKELLMNAPRMELAEEGKRAYATIAHLAKDIGQFIGIDRLLRENGFAAPEIYAFDLKKGLLLSENLGDQGIVDENRTPIRERYIAAVELLAHFHSKKWPSHKSWYDIALVIPAYDREVLKIEVNLLLDWYIPYKANIAISDDICQRYHKIWDSLFDLIDKSPQTLVMRDYHSPNIIWRENLDKHSRLGLIDFQDGLIGPIAYDVASLAQDARVTVTPELEKEILACYCSKRIAIQPDFDETRFRNDYAIIATQRLSKILGIFVRLDKRDGKPNYLSHLPRLMEYLERNLKNPILTPLKTYYHELGIIGS